MEITIIRRLIVERGIEPDKPVVGGAHRQQILQSPKLVKRDHVKSAPINEQVYAAIGSPLAGGHSAILLQSDQEQFTWLIGDKRLAESASAIQVASCREPTTSSSGCFVMIGVFGNLDRTFCGNGGTAATSSIFLTRMRRNSD